MNRKVRTIMHLDMDAFYASVEQQDFPELRGRPVVVGGGKRGVVSAASYEARRYGIHSAMPMFQALKKCPDLLVRPVRMRRYQEVSRMIMELLRTVSPLVEPLSIDEAFVDLTGTEALHGPPRKAAQRLKEKIRRKTGLTCSVGIAPNKLLAKIASDQNKPDGLTVIAPEQVESFLADFPVAKIPGIGPTTVEKLKALGVSTCGQVLGYPVDFWTARFGDRTGRWIHERASGRDRDPVQPHRPIKSIGAENTFEEDLDSDERLFKWLLLQSERVARRLRRKGLQGRTVTLKVKYDDFKQITRSRTLPTPTDSTETLFRAVVALFQNVPRGRKIRLTGVSVSQLSQGRGQLCLFEDRREMRSKRLDVALDTIRDRFGAQALRRGRLWDVKLHLEQDDAKGD
ncbi:DNA polymerase-4 [Desulfacinum hydrothermale DSM 13146]|uniref:DNA polymerase IV n=1 Tax=Desulfacinum hydrothermale DSM 13146 TaxID=1121390 RepID=A0A1W1XQQ4_9BACT|nr:DNA polymerase IV [Desulfacinum hydrothermale]SMC25838.1 DNA polymerase-4 [Desulfacinum hydrothermale DSM 13146]